MAAKNSGAAQKIIRSKATETAAQRLTHTGLPDVDHLIYERVRLGIVSALAVNESLTFKELKDYLQTTDGNLSVHARRLEDAGFIACLKSFEGRTPKTEYRLTASGRAMLEKYLQHMEALIRAIRRQ